MGPARRKRDQQRSQNFLGLSIFCLDTKEAKMDTIERVERGPGEEEPGFDEINALDCTRRGDSSQAKPIRLQNGVELNRLLNGDGVDLIPEIDDDLANQIDGAVADTPDFFKNLRGADEETVAKAVDGLDLNLDLDFGDDLDGTFADLELQMEKVTPDGGVMKKVIKPGLDSEGLVPERGTVTVHYKMFVEGQDETFDSTWLRGRAERFQVDDGQLLPGMEYALKSMKKKERSRFLISPDYGYGQLGVPPRIPPAVQILLEAEMLDFVDEGLPWKTSS